MTYSRKNTENNSVLQIRLPQQLHKDFLSICDREGYSGSGLIRKWMREFVSEQAPEINSANQTERGYSPAVM